MSIKSNRISDAGGIYAGVGLTVVAAASGVAHGATMTFTNFNFTNSTVGSSSTLITTLSNGSIGVGSTADNLLLSSHAGGSYTTSSSGNTSYYESYTYGYAYATLNGGDAFGRILQMGRMATAPGGGYSYYYVQNPTTYAYPAASGSPTVLGALRGQTITVGQEMDDNTYTGSASFTLTRQCGHSFLRRNECREVDEPGEVGGLFLVPCGHTSAPADAAEEPLDHVAVPVPPPVVTLLTFPRRVRPDAAAGSKATHALTQRVAVISGIGDHVPD